MKEKIKEKLNERLEYILTKNVEDISTEEFMALSSKLNNIELEESKEERNKEFADIVTKILKS